MQIEFAMNELPEAFARDTVDRVNSGDTPVTAFYNGKPVGTVVKGTAYLKDGRVQRRVVDSIQFPLGV
jgi:hypothetical protein